jgi:hexosaminidase
VRKRIGVVTGVLAVAAVVAGLVFIVVHHRAPQPGPGAAARAATGWASIVPAPASTTPSAETFHLTPGAPIVANAAATPIGTYLATLRGHGSSVQRGDARPAAGIALLVDPAAPDGAEAYQLDIDATGVTIRARTAAGLFWGVQTLRQLLPGDPGAAVALPGGRVVDRPRLAYRGVMLDVARHFVSVAHVERLIDLSTMYKVNYLHLHLTDDQGWRIAIDGWPRLTSIGGLSAVGGGDGGFYTKDDYRQIVAYAAARFVTVVPEVDLPGHTNAALASYAELNCDGKAPPAYTGIDVGFSVLCADAPATDRFLRDVLSELAALTPGPYLHIGGDEASSMTPAAYASVVQRAEAIFATYGKTVIGWHQLAGASLNPSAVLEFWDIGMSAPNVSAAAAAGHRVIMSPANHAYLDQKYDENSRIGLQWAGPTSVEEAYDWDPTGLLRHVGEDALLGLEGALWTETVTTMDDIEYLVFPRLAALAELAWSPPSTHDWVAFQTRLAAQGPRWDALGVHYARTTDVPWP